MIKKTDKYRMRIYINFALQARKENVTWVVAHGIEGYPDTIGRDLDILCYDEDNIQKAARIFSEVAKTDGDTKWVVFPSTIWGKRVLAISKNFEVAELHILYRLNTGLVHCSIDWNKTNHDLFPINKKVLQFKGFIQPLIGGTAKLWKYSSKDITNLPWSVKRLVTKNEKGKKISNFDKLLVYLQLGNGPMNMYKCYKYACFIRTQFKNSQTSPIYCIPNYKEYADCLNEAFNELFFKIECCDTVPISKIKHLNQRQNMVILTSHRNDIKEDYKIEISDKTSLEKIIDSFSEYNLKRTKIYDETFQNFITFIKALE